MNKNTVLLIQKLSSFCLFTFIVFCSFRESNIFFCKFTKLYCNFCHNEQTYKKMQCTWISKHSWAVFIPNWCTYDFHYGRTTLNPVAYNQWNKSSLCRMSFIWNCFKLVFSTFWKKKQKWLVSFCISFEGAIFFTKKANYAQLEPQALIE